MSIPFTIDKTNWNEIVKREELRLGMSERFSFFFDDHLVYRFEDDTTPGFLESWWRYGANDPDTGEGATGGTEDYLQNNEPSNGRGFNLADGYFFSDMQDNTVRFPTRGDCCSSDPAEYVGLSANYDVVYDDWGKFCEACGGSLFSSYVGDDYGFRRITGLDENSLPIVERGLLDFYDNYDYMGPHLAEDLRLAFENATHLLAGFSSVGGNRDGSRFSQAISSSPTTTISSDGDGIYLNGSLTGSLILDATVEDIANISASGSDRYSVSLIDRDVNGRVGTVFADGDAIALYEYAVVTIQSATMTPNANGSYAVSSASMTINSEDTNGVAISLTYVTSNGGPTTGFSHKVTVAGAVINNLYSGSWPTTSYSSSKSYVDQGWCTVVTSEFTYLVIESTGSSYYSYNANRIPFEVVGYISCRTSTGTGSPPTPTGNLTYPLVDSSTVFDATGSLTIEMGFLSPDGAINTNEYVVGVEVDMILTANFTNA